MIFDHFIRNGVLTGVLSWHRTDNGPIGLSLVYEGIMGERCEIENTVTHQGRTF